MQSDRDFRNIALTATIIAGIFVGIFFYLMIFQPQMVPKDENFLSFWLKNSIVLFTALSFIFTALSSIRNSIEQRNLRLIENYPYLEISSFLSLWSFPLPYPRYDVPNELKDFATDFWNTVAPSQPFRELPADTNFRYFGLILRNVGHGRITRIVIAGTAEITEVMNSAKSFYVDRMVNLAPDQTLNITLIPITNIPSFLVKIDRIEYEGHFDKMTRFYGPRQFERKAPFTDFSSEARETLFLDHFEAPPAGAGWVLDFWGQWGPTDYMNVPPPSGDDHYLVIRGNTDLFAEHHKQQGGAFKDLLNIFSTGETVKVTATVKAHPGTTAKIRLWCHDNTEEGKSSYSDEITPSIDRQELSVLYTCRRSPNLRIHLLYAPGAGEIQVDKVLLEKLHTESRIL